MTSKEEARELIDKMYNSEYCGIKHFPNKRYCECVEMNLFQAKQCALIAVDYIRDNCEWNQHLYWLEVKQEIEKL